MEHEIEPPKINPKLGFVYPTMLQKTAVELMLQKQQWS
jgi:hypothetical protein